MATYEDIKTDAQTYIEIDDAGRTYNINILDPNYQSAIQDNVLVLGDVVPKYKVLIAESVFEALIAKIDELQRRIESLEQVK